MGTNFRVRRQEAEIPEVRTGLVNPVFDEDVINKVHLNVSSKPL